ncbi:hypothetical protein DRQ50_05195, partial [bacterium]
MRCINTRPLHMLRPIFNFIALAAVLLAGVLFIDGPAPEPGPTVPDGVEADWWSRVTGDLEAREYRGSACNEGWQAPNRRQDLRTIFGADAVTVTPRGADPAWSWQWSLSHWGRSGAMTAVAPVAPRSLGDRVQYERGALVEWYENRPEGVEQGFTVATALPGQGELVLAGLVQGDLTATPGAGGELHFTDAAGSMVLDYAGLKAWDSAGRELPARMDWHDGELQLTVDDRDAIYPVTIDPILTTPSWIEEGDRADARFGFVVATAGDINGDGYSDVIVGSPHYSVSGTDQRGKAWLYRGYAAGLYANPSWEWVGENANDQFGYSVACAGDINGDGYDDIIVGAPTYEGPTDQDGRAYVFHGSSGGLGPLAAWSGRGGSSASSLFFGMSVATAGDLNADGYDDVVVGDPNVGAYAGRVSVWYGSSTGLGAGADWWDEGGGSMFLGRSVSTAGDINGDGLDDLVVGSPGYQNGDNEEGAIFIYLGSKTSLPATPDQIVESNTDYFHMGHAVTLAGDINGDGYGDVLTGCAPSIDFTEEWPNVRLYLGSETGLSTTADWSYGAHLTEETMGRHVACAGDMNGDGYADIAIGYEGYGASRGRIMVFLGNFDGLTAYPNWTANGSGDNAMLGPVATAGDVNGDGYSDLIGGAPGYEGVSTERGEARCWLGGSYGVRLAAGWVVESNQAYAQFGYSLAPAGDVNGDGYSDLLVGSPYYDNGEPEEGAVFLYLGSLQGLAWIPAWWAESDHASAAFGTSVASAGDVNGDGLPDILVGAPGLSITHAMEGGAFLWHSVLGGAPNGNPTNADWVYMPGQTAAALGRSVACAGDVNGDGYADVVVGAPEYDNGQTDEGMVFVFHGSSTGLPATADWTHDTGKTDCDYGFSVASAGDMNGDGYSDIIVGAPTYDHPGDSMGLAFVYTGSATGLHTGAPWWHIASNQVGAHLGYCVAPAGDVNGDGFSDVIVGSPFWDTGWVNGGRAQVWHGAATAPATGSDDNHDWEVHYDNTGGYMGWSVASAGDVNADGYSDVIIGSPGVNFDGLSDSGFAEVHHGSATGLSEPFTDWFDGVSVISAFFGQAVASAGDVNGDGFSDIVVGAPGYTGGQDTEGRAFVYYGGGSRGMSRTPRMWQDDLTTQLAPLGGSVSQSGFALGARGRTAFGRGKVRLVCEVKSAGTPFNGTGTVMGVWTDTGVPVAGVGSVVEMTRAVTGL